MNDFHLPQGNLGCAGIREQWIISYTDRVSWTHLHNTNELLEVSDSLTSGSQASPRAGYKHHCQGSGGSPIIWTLWNEPGCACGSCIFTKTKS